MTTNGKQKTSSGRFRKLLRESFFISLLTMIADFFARGIKKSIFARIFTGYEKVEELYAQSFTGGLLSRIFSVSKKKRSLKSFIASACENSFILQKLKKNTSSMLAKPLRYYGSGLVYFGVYVCVIHIVKYLAIVDAELSLLSLGTGILCLIAGIMLIPSKKCTAHGICESKILSFLLFTVIGLDDGELKKYQCSSTPSHASSIAIGTILGLASFFVEPVALLAALMALAGVSLVMYSPETGMIIVFFTLPFLPTMALAGLVALTAVSYLYKVARGKRVFKLEFFDLLVLCFAIIVLFSGLISYGGGGSLPPALMFCCFLAAYFLAVNLLKSRALIEKCVNRMLIGSAIVAIYGIYQNFFGSTTAAWLDSYMFDSIGNRVVSTFENPNVLGQYLILMLPFAILFTLNGKDKNVKFCSLVATALLAVCLIFTWSRGAWLGAIFGIVIVLLLYSRTMMKICVACVFAIPLLPFVVPSTIMQRFTSIGNLGDSSTQYRVNIWKGTLDMVSHHFWGGIGMGESAFRSVYPTYSLEAIEKAPHSHNLFLQQMAETGIFGMLFLVVLFYFFFKLCADFVVQRYRYDMQSINICLAGMGGIAAVLLQGFTDYIWYNYRFFLLFWLVIALCVSARRNNRDAEMAKQTDII